MKIDILVTNETKKKGSGIENLDGIIHCWGVARRDERAKAEEVYKSRRDSRMQ